MRDLVVKVISKEITTGTKSFTAYSLLTSKLKWYRTSKIELSELAKVDGKVVVVRVSRKYLKKVINSKGEELEFPTLVVESIREPNDKELAEYEKSVNELNDQTLADME